jgi:AraC family transcriptional activator of pobA
MSDMKRLQATREDRDWPIAHVLFVQQSVIKKHRSTGSHRHPFWQLELVISGRQRVRFGRETLPLEKGDLVLIPTDCGHRFDYPYPETETCSVKFSLRGLEAPPGPAVVFPCPESEGIRDALLALLSQEEPIRRRSVIAVEHLLAALVDLQYHPEGEDRVEPELVRTVREHLEAQGGGPVSVADLAQHTGYSRSRLSELFHEQAGVTMKQYIDEHRAEAAEALLRYSDYNFSRIADTMGFPDLFTFSRFFKRMRGKSPRQFRKSPN